MKLTLTVATWLLAFVGTAFAGADCCGDLIACCAAMMDCCH